MQISLFSQTVARIFPVINKENPVIAWWSGGITSAVTCWLCIQWFGKENVRVVFIDTFNEDPDTYRFMSDCEKWYGCYIESAWNPKYTDIKQVWIEYQSLNVATGAICSTELKRVVREKFQKDNSSSYQAFGFEISETDRAIQMKLNYPDSKPIFPLIIELLSKTACIKIVQEAGIKIPEAYRLGLNNNNCLKQYGCVQGGVGYWQLMKKIKPDNFDRMAAVEHEITDLAGRPVTMLKDQSKDGGLVFLKPHSNYPEIKDISMMKGRPPKPLVDCNGFCGITNVGGHPTEKEINYDDQMSRHLVAS